MQREKLEYERTFIVKSKTWKLWNERSTTCPVVTEFIEMRKADEHRAVEHKLVCCVHEGIFGDKYDNETINLEY